MVTNLQTFVECPRAPNGLTFATYWYRPLGIDEIRISTCCFEEKAACSRFARLFERYWYMPSSGEQVCCNFNTEQVNQLFGNALHSEDLGPFLSFPVRRLNLPACPGIMGYSGGNDLCWYGIREIPEFMACEACFEDVCQSPSLANTSQHITGSKILMTYGPAT